MVAIVQTLAILKATESVSAIEALLIETDHTLAREAAISLEKITGKSYAAEISRHTRPSYLDHDWAAIARIVERPLCELQTSRGTVVIELFPEESPFTCLSFARLMEKQFYDGLRFHRVVPNFVVQGGDPRGDGWGGPGYSIRSEFGYRGYDRGMVGVASAGKDTEGCQFFITHSRTPHLDGRYTIFGRVVEGMEIVDLIQVGDSIQSFRLLDEN
jgi:peptidylprolyl isomerase